MYEFNFCIDRLSLQSVGIGFDDKLLIVVVKLKLLSVKANRIVRTYKKCIKST